MFQVIVEVQFPFVNTTYSQFFPVFLSPQISPSLSSLAPRQQIYMMVPSLSVAAVRKEPVAACSLIKDS